MGKCTPIPTNILESALHSPGQNAPVVLMCHI